MRGKLKELLKSRGGIKLDVGCGSNKQKGFVGMDRRAVDGVEIVHDVKDIPWPLPDECCHTVLMSHLWEHIPPDARMDVMDEIWRVMRDDGQLLISTPYATSFGANQDPTHYPCPNEATFTYWDPSKPLYQIYRPRPWRLARNNWQTTGNMEVVMEKISMNGEAEK